MTLTWTETRFQPVSLTPEESRARGQQLAGLLQDRDDLLLRQKVEKDKMKDAMGELDARVHHLAAVVLNGVEERSVAVELRLNETLGMVETVRLDTGELLSTRDATHDDRRRAQATLPGLASLAGFTARPA